MQIAEIELEPSPVLHPSKRALNLDVMQLSFICKELTNESGCHTPTAGGRFRNVLRKSIQFHLHSAKQRAQVHST